MRDVIFGLVAIAAGTVFCFWGYLAFRIVIPIWGAFVGFSASAAVIAAVTGDGFLATGPSWLAGVVGAIVFSALAYLYYGFAVTVAMGSIGFALGASLMVAVGAGWTWAVALVAVVAGFALAFAAISTNLPALLLALLSSTSGASAIAAGAMVVVGAISLAEISDGSAVARANDGWWWYVAWVGLVVAGVIAQARAAERQLASLRGSWAPEGAGPLR